MSRISGNAEISSESQTLQDKYQQSQHAASLRRLRAENGAQVPMQDQQLPVQQVHVQSLDLQTCTESRTASVDDLPPHHVDAEHIGKPERAFLGMNECR